MDNIKIKRWICDILLFLCFTAIAFFAGKILINQWKYKKAQKEYDTLQKAVQTEKSINWKKLKRINKDIVAWMKYQEQKLVIRSFREKIIVHIYIGHSIRSTIHRVVFF